MNEPDADSPPPPRPSPETSGCAQAGCLLAGGVMVVAGLYVGTYVYLVADVINEWGLTASLDQKTIDVLEIIYAPLIWIVVWMQERGYI